MIEIRFKIIIAMMVFIGMMGIAFGSYNINKSKIISDAAEKKNKMTTGVTFVIVGIVLILSTMGLVYMMKKNPVDMDKFSDFRFSNNNVDIDDSRF